MSTIIFYFALGLVVLMIVSKIPGLELLVKPIIDLTFKAITLLVENGYLWGIWLLKLLVQSHREVLVNLFTSAEKLDPSLAITQKKLKSLEVRKEYFPFLLKWESNLKSYAAKYFSLK